MSTSLAERPPPGHMREGTHVTTRAGHPKVVRVRTQPKPWDREGFFSWLDQRMKELDIPDIQTLCDMARPKISASAPSKWRSGRHRPTLEALEALASPLKVTKEFLWARAGLIGEASQIQALTPEEQAGIDIIEAANLDDGAKEKLKVIHLANVLRDRQERLRQLREQIDLLSRD